VPISTSHRNSPPEGLLRVADVRLYEKVVGQLQNLKAEFAVLSKTKPDNALNQLKVEIVNERLKDANRLLIGEHKPFASFDEFGGDKIPTNSDVLLVLSQYLAAFDRWRSAHVYADVLNNWYWRTEDGNIAV
jgi:hypothetical protein